MPNLRGRAGRRRGTRAFTLVEVLVALAIFSIALLAMVPLFSMAARAGRGSQQLTRATGLARTYVDKLRNTPFARIGVNAPPATGTCDPCTPPATEVTNNAPFVVSWTVRAADGSPYDVAAPPTPNVKRVTVTVTVPCADCAGGQRQVRMVTIIAERS